MPTLRELRKRSYLSQEELARVSSVPRESISRFENGRKLPGPRTLQALARALRVEPEVIFFPKQKRPAPAVSPAFPPGREQLELFRLILDNGIRELLNGVPEHSIAKYFGKKKLADYILKVKAENAGVNPTGDSSAGSR